MIEVEKHNNVRKLKIKVIDVMVLPDYLKFIQPYSDPKLALYSKEEATKHQ